ncbi:MAG: hypothetical protein IJ680_02060, partial [Paludibacteraceae bacterium]|nr:hypothetical protein [Paludibacteraceae bacterium]
LLATYIVMARQMRGEDERRTFELKKSALQTISPIRLRGYERLALLLERTKPEAMLMQMPLPTMTCLQLQQQMLTSVRQEFEHNASQQIYVSTPTWYLIVAAREGLLGLINTCAAYVKPDDPAIKLAEVLIQTYNGNGETATDKAMQALKDEVKLIL